MYRPNTAFDVLQIPFIGRLLRWRWGRLTLQIPLAIFAGMLIIDGFTGPPEASRNLATVAPWVHYRGLVVLALLLAGNLFCMGCPFTLPRTLAKRLSARGRRFPKILRNKWLAIISLFTLFFLYEWLDLWASPVLTAWLVVAYFAASFVLEAVFTESAFCKYVCPLGTFNFVYSTASPAQIGVKNPAVCAACVGKECVNGSYSSQTAIRIDEIPVFDAGGSVVSTQPKEIVHNPAGTPGCGTELFAPQIKSNLDCTFCLDCVRACPHDNASLFLRPPGRELTQPDAWAKRWDVSLLVICLAFMGVTNAFGMVPPIYQLQAWMVYTFRFQNELPMLLIIFGVGNLLLPITSAFIAAGLSRLFTGSKASLREITAAFAPAFIPAGFAIWFAHYSFHFLIAPFSLVPVMQEFLGQVGDWTRFSGSLDINMIGLLQVVVLAGGFLWSMVIAQRAALRLYKRAGLPGMLPWALVLLLLMLAALNIFSLPMEMRGTNFVLG